MRKKSRNKDRDFTELEKSKVREKTLKREVARLRKIVHKLQEEHSMLGVEELLEAQKKDNVKVKKEEEKIDKVHKWKCFDCDEGVLLLNVLTRIDGVFYFRRCNMCSKRTKFKKYTDDVQGVKSEDL